MRFAVISDIHSNLEALTEVLRAVEAQKVDRVVSLGDIVGYGASPNECCGWCGTSPRSPCSGTTTPPWPAGWTTPSITTPPATPWTGPPSVISDENLAWLRSLPYTYRIGDIGFSHGSPVDPTRLRVHLRARAGARAGAGVQDLPEVTFIGHSHLCKAFALGNGEVNDVVAQKFGVPARLQVHHLGGQRGSAARLRQPGLLRDL